MKLIQFLISWIRGEQCDAMTKVGNRPGYFCCVRTKHHFGKHLTNYKLKF